VIVQPFVMSVALWFQTVSFVCALVAAAPTAFTCDAVMGSTVCLHPGDRMNDEVEVRGMLWVCDGTYSRN